MWAVLSLIVCTMATAKDADCTDGNVCAAQPANTGWDARQKLFTLDSKPPTTQSLGHSTWMLLHTTAAYLPESSAGGGGVIVDDKREAFISMVNALRKIYPDEAGRKTLDAIFNDVPSVQTSLSDIQTRDDAVYFTAMLHNLVTQRISKTTALFGVPKAVQKAAIKKDQPVNAAGRTWFQTLLAEFKLAADPDTAKGPNKQGLVMLAYNRWNWGNYNRMELGHPDQIVGQINGHHYAYTHAEAHSLDVNRDIGKQIEWMKRWPKQTGRILKLALALVIAMVFVVFLLKRVPNANCMGGGGSSARRASFAGGSFQRMTPAADIEMDLKTSAGSYGSSKFSSNDIDGPIV
jgi:hypothetical protein